MYTCPSSYPDFETPPKPQKSKLASSRLKSALPMAYYMAARRGLDWLMDARLPTSATLSGQTLRSAMRGLMALREMELKEVHQIVFTIKDTSNLVGCSSTDCPSRHFKGLLNAETIGAHQRTFGRVTGSAVGRTRILQVLSASEFSKDVESKLCQVCVKKIQVEIPWILASPKTDGVLHQQISEEIIWRRDPLAITRSAHNA